MKIRCHLLSVTALAAVSALTSPAFAHESRLLHASTGNIRMTVGFLAEPAFEDSFNGLDLFLYTYDGPCPIDKSDFFGNPIDTRAGDIVDLKVEALYLDKSAPPTGIKGSQPPAGATILKSLLITDKSPVSRVFGDPGHYHSSYKPTHPGNPDMGGAYGFHIYGSVSAKTDTEYTCDADTNTPTTQTIKARSNNKIDSYWVCGSAGVFPGDTGRFNCVEAIQPFPGKAEDGYEASKPFTGSKHKS
jgi:hypothetical protein